MGQGRGKTVQTALEGSEGCEQPAGSRWRYRGWRSSAIPINGKNVSLARRTRGAEGKKEQKGEKQVEVEAEMKRTLQIHARRRQCARKTLNPNRHAKLVCVIRRHQRLLEDVRVARYGPETVRGEEGNAALGGVGGGMLSWCSDEGTVSVQQY